MTGVLESRCPEFGKCGEQGQAGGLLSPSPLWGMSLTLTTATVKKMVEAWKVGPAGGQLPHVTWDGSSL